MSAIRRPGERRPTVWFNPQAFAAAAIGTFGSLGRNSLRGPGYVSLDLALFKNIAVTERFRLQLRAESFNVLNTPTSSTRMPPSPRARTSAASSRRRIPACFSSG